MDIDVPFSEPIASTSRAVFTLPYKESTADFGDEAEEDYSLSSGVELYDRAWSTCNASIQAALSSLHDSSLDQIVSFVHVSPSAGNTLYAALADRVPLRTGLIVGATPGSSSLLYSSLIRLLSSPSLKTSSTPSSPPSPVLVSRISSRDCSNIKNALRSVIGGFVGSAANVELDEEDEDEELDDGGGGGKATIKSALLVPEDMLNLVAWYEHRFANKGSASSPTLAILIEDLEALDGKVLTQLLTTLSLYTSSLPLVLLIGIATTPSALYNLVPSSTCNKLDAQVFAVDPGVRAFDQLVRGVFLDGVDGAPPPLGLGPKAYTEMWRMFEDLHHSIDATVSYIQYLYMTHFLSSPLSFLTLFTSTSQPSSLPSNTSTLLSTLPSLSSSSPSCSDLIPILLTPTSPPELSDALLFAREQYEEYHAARSEAFEALGVLGEVWEKRKTTEGLLGMVLGAGAEEADGGQGGGGKKGGLGKYVDEVCGLVLQASFPKLLSCLTALTTRLSSLPPSSSSPSSLLSFLRHLLASLSPLKDAPRAPGKTNLTNLNIAGFANLPGFGVGGQGGLGEADREFSRIAKEVAEGLRERLKSALRPSTDVLLHELWLTNDSTASKRFNPTPLPNLFRTLSKLDPFSDPSYHPPSPSSNLDGEENQEPIPLDLAVAYRTYKEGHSGGRLANLGEWFAAFELGVGEEPEEEESGAGGRGNANGDGKGGKGKGKGRAKKKARRDEDRGGGEEEDEEDDEEEEEEDEEEEDEGPQRRKQTRFLRALGDLAHLGFVHPTTYKPEHVLKSVY